MEHKIVTEQYGNLDVDLFRDNYSRYSTRSAFTVNIQAHECFKDHTQVSEHSVLVDKMIVGEKSRDSKQVTKILSCKDVNNQVST